MGPFLAIDIYLIILKLYHMPYECKAEHIKHAYHSSCHSFILVLNLSPILRFFFFFWMGPFLAIDIYLLILKLYHMPYLYIYKTETFETPTIFHVSIILKKKS